VNDESSLMPVDASPMASSHGDEQLCDSAPQTQSGRAQNETQKNANQDKPKMTEAPRLPPSKPMVPLSTSSPVAKAPPKLASGAPPPIPIRPARLSPSRRKKAPPPIPTQKPQTPTSTTPVSETVGTPASSSEIQQVESPLGDAEDVAASLADSKKSLAARWEIFDFKKVAPPPSSTTPEQISISAFRKVPLPPVFVSSKTSTDALLNAHFTSTSHTRKIHLSRKQVALGVGLSELQRAHGTGSGVPSATASSQSMNRSLYMDINQSNVNQEKLTFRSRMESFMIMNRGEGKLNGEIDVDGQLDPTADTAPEIVFAEYEEFVPTLNPDETEVNNKRRVKKKGVSDETLAQIAKLRQEYAQGYIVDPQLQQKHNEAATTIQCNARRLLARKAATRRRRKKSTRENNARELLSTERNYVDSLDVLREVYFLPLQEKSKDPKPLLTPSQFKLIFGHLETIHRVNKMFLDGCEKMLPNYNETSLISSLFHGYTHLFKSYTAYCNNFDAASACIKQLKTTNQEFAAWLKSQDKDPRTNRLGLQSYLILPIQRIPRYRLLLQDIIKHTDQEHKDYAGLQTSLSEILSVANHLNSTMKQIEASVQLLNIQSQFQNLPDNFEIQAPWRTFIKDATFRNSLDQQSIHVHLFNDMIVFSKKNRGQFSFKNKVELNHIKIYDFNIRFTQHQPQQVEQRFKIKSLNLEMELMCASETQKFEWLNAIHHAIELAGGFKLNVRVDNANEKSTFLEALSDDLQDELNPEECLEEMKTKGATMLKYCRTGKPHFRHFVLSADEKKICWGSKKKRANDSKVLLAKVTDLRTGQTTDLFRKYLNPDVESESWSLLYGKGRSLDLVASDRRDFLVWITGLRYLLQNGPRAIQTKPDGTPISSSEHNIVKSIEKSKFENKFQEIGDSYTWGQCTRGSLGHGDQEDQHIPLVMKDFLYLDVLGIYCGDSVAFGVMTNGALFSWGGGKYGRTGHGDESDRLKPTRVEAFRGKKVTRVAVGTHHTLVLMSDGSVYSVGGGEYGQLGNGEFSKFSLEPQKIEGNLENHHVTFIASGSMHCAAVTNNGEMFVWGRGEDGQLGLGNRENQPLPTLVHALNNESIVTCALGMWHTMALTRDGRVYVWGDTTYGQCGIGDQAKKSKVQLVPTILSMDLLPRKVMILAAGSSHSGAIADDGSVWMWGNGMYGQLGNGEKANSFSPVRVRDLQHEKAIQITCGVNHTMVLTESNCVYTWGAGTYGRLGIRDEKDQPLPRLIEFLKEKEVREINAGGCMSGCVCAHQWVPDFDAKKCMNCNRDFTIIRRRHHCRYCGGLFCGACSSKKVTLLRFGFDSRVRVCGVCYSIILGEQKAQKS